eukprot:TRINITY_DN4078_c1_g1_i2.p1 TRINITY_DN4078_c1_g1~~TRINITY_DN4078_c1_g1_i2.p1  ORF type:complete len:337 (+),score=95.78 TRINITY_DN4078_c1_g1_i2:14-1024(+)
MSSQPKGALGWLNWATTSSISSSFVEFIGKIGDAKSKQDEERIIKNELKTMKSMLGEMEMKEIVHQKEFLIKILYCEMLGHSASFAYIHAIKLTKQSDPTIKRLCYLVLSLGMKKNDELMLLVTSSVSQELTSMKYVCNWTALVFLSQVVNTEIIPAVLPLVKKLFKHERSLIRKKVVSVLHKFWLSDESSVEDCHDLFRIALCDRDPSVMSTSLALFYDLCKSDPLSQKDLVPTFVSILKQIGPDRALPPGTFEYHTVPSPWAQITLLRILAILGRGDAKTSGYMYTVISETMEAAEKAKNNAGFAIVFECLVTIVSIVINKNLLNLAAQGGSVL